MNRLVPALVCAAALLYRVTPQPPRGDFSVAVAAPGELHLAIAGKQTLRDFVAAHAEVASAVNAGFFDNVGDALWPTGLVVADEGAWPSIATVADGSDPIRRRFAAKAAREQVWHQVFYVSRSGEVGFGPAAPADARLAIEAGPRLLERRAIQYGEIAKRDGSSRARRTGVGVLDDGRVIFCATRRSMTLTEFAGHLRDLGAHDAINFDGGSSTSFYGGALDTIGGRPVHTILYAVHSD